MYHIHDGHATWLFDPMCERNINFFHFTRSGMSQNSSPINVDEENRGINTRNLWDMTWDKL